jgi:hypothetical protein
MGLEKLLPFWGKIMPPEKSLIGKKFSSLTPEEKNSLNGKIYVTEISHDGTIGNALTQAHESGVIVAYGNNLEEIGSHLKEYSGNQNNLMYHQK